MKIIGVGFQKTGTSTLRDALTILGYKVGDTKFKLLFPILKGNYYRVLKELNRYDAVEDNPWCMIYKEIDQLVPGCKFILTIRDEESWYKSASRHIGDLRVPMHEWIYGRGKGLPKDDKENSIRVYKKHNDEVIEYFKYRQRDLLILDFTKNDGWEKLCVFLGKSIPTVPFPHANKSAYQLEKKPNFFRKMNVLKKKIKYGLQIWSLDIRKMW